MKEHPKSFNSKEVEAIRDGSKTMFREVIKPQPYEEAHLEVGHYHPALVDKGGEQYPGDEVFGAYTKDGEYAWKCPYGGVGSRLWLKETWVADKQYDHLKPSEIPDTAKIYYINKLTRKAGGYSLSTEIGKTRSAMFMCHWMSRVRLEITEVRAERVQEIRWRDVKAEGCYLDPKGIFGFTYDTYAQNIFGALWNSLNAKKGYGWDTNCFVWVRRFKKVEK